jgi:hypothetical protein
LGKSDSTRLALCTIKMLKMLCTCYVDGVISESVFREHSKLKLIFLEKIADSVDGWEIMPLYSELLEKYGSVIYNCNTL